jgi:hypothetical protein
MPDTVIRCRFDVNHEVFAGGFYDVRWFRSDDLDKLVEITRERFPLRNHTIGRRPGSVSRSNPRLAPKSAAHQRGRDQAAEAGSRCDGERGRDQSTQSGKGPLAIG